MGEFVVKKDSWHYKWLARYLIIRDIWEPKGSYRDNSWRTPDTDISYFERNYRRPRDFCSYWRNIVMWPAIRFTLNTIPYIVLFIMLSVSGIPVVATGIGFIFGGIIAVALLILLAFGANKLIRKGVETVTDAATAVEQTSFFVGVYKSYKDNFCRFINYEEDKNE